MAASAPASGRAAKVMVVMGPPASGKGTQCKRLAAALGMVHVSVGDLCRDKSGKNTAEGREVRAHMERGGFVPDEFMAATVAERIAQPDAVAASAVLLDGYPRTAAQAKSLLEHTPVEGFVLLRVPDDTCLRRALGRRMDKDTGAIYHLDYAPPPASVPQERLEQRVNDISDKVVMTRLARYNETIKDITSQFPGRVVEIDGAKAIDDVYAQLLKVVGDSIGATPGAAGTSLPPAAPAPAAPAQDDEEWPEDEEATGASGATDLALDVGCAQEAQDGGTVECPVMVRIRMPEGEDNQTTQLARSKSGRAVRPPADVCCVVDISGSMGSRATYEVDGKVKDDCLNYLDVVKHAVKTVMHILKDQDRFALVAFDAHSERVLDLCFMTKEGREKASAALDSLRPRGNTNLWGGILEGMEALRAPGPTADAATGRRRQTILLLTDGQPNVKPPRGHVPELRDYKEAHPDFNFQLNTFGFGYNLDSQLLLDLGVEGQGTFAFIPDAVIVGTAFVNSVANALSTHTQNATLHLSEQGGAQFAGPVLGIGDHQVTDASWGRVVSLGPLQFGQSREVVVPMHIPAGTQPYLEAVVVYSGGDGKALRASTKGVSRALHRGAVAAVARNQTVDLGYQAVRLVDAGDDIDKALAQMGDLGRRIAEMEKISGLTAVGELRADVEGRMSKALTGKDRYKRWGKHYLLALTRAHQLQLCTNFMDTGLQSYGGALFQALKGEGDKIFLTLPPPKPASQAAPRRSTTSATASTASTAAASKRAPSPDMSTYYAGAGGGCFGPTSSVQVARPGGLARTRVTDVRRGDEVLVAGGGLARVRCAIRIARRVGKPLVQLDGGLSITSQHPVRVGVGAAVSWRRACDLVDTGATLRPCDSRFVYNFVLDRSHVLLVDGVECVTWGHGLQGDVVEHAFFGSQHVVSELQGMSGWAHGLVHIAGCFKDASTREVVGLREVEEEPEVATPGFPELLLPVPLPQLCVH